MASLSTYVTKYGTRTGRRKYNADHRAYRQQHLEDLRKYDRERYKAKKQADK
jgi:hypothetical protein